MAGFRKEMKSVRVKLRMVVWQKILGFNRGCPWPVSIHNQVTHPENIDFDPACLHIFQGIGKTFQADANITIGKDCHIGPQVALITRNHDLYNPMKMADPKPITIGDYCWIGHSATILPGVTLGPHTIVGAGAVVTHSFPNGNCVIAGIPAKTIKKL